MSRTKQLATIVEEVTRQAKGHAPYLQLIAPWHRLVGALGQPPPVSPTTATAPATFNVAVLDASFNPPTLAHAKLLQATLQGLTATLEDWKNKWTHQCVGEAYAANPWATSASTLPTSPPTSLDKPAPTAPSATVSFDAGLLLVSTANADKQLTGASLAQRLAMLELLVQDLQSATCSPALPVALDANLTLCLGLTNCARFVDKLTALRRFVARQQTALGLSKHTTPRFYFILGADTVSRFFDPKYYATSPPASTPSLSSPATNRDPMHAQISKFFQQGGRLVFAPRDAETNKELWTHVLDRTPTSAMAPYLRYIYTILPSLCYDEAGSALKRDDARWMSQVSSTRVRQYVLENGHRSDLASALPMVAGDGAVTPVPLVSRAVYDYICNSNLYR
ncbi:hypothetical protein H4R34_000726 [Dimargaris verticillata]|uniref:Nicotinamide-nucleotide adenylyltransferase n=1 Tax=Dimargaris verticillata TaxID=2761393 RepID=A0A9W8EB08_9FUNG|nr:hypothetical protein H4R34_000726 [Dimargaris verticillata]